MIGTTIIASSVAKYLLSMCNLGKDFPTRLGSGEVLFAKAFNNGK